MLLTMAHMAAIAGSHVQHSYGYDRAYPAGPSTQYLSTLVPNTIKSMDFGTRNLKYWVFGHSGLDNVWSCCMQRYLRLVILQLKHMAEVFSEQVLSLSI